MNTNTEELICDRQFNYACMWLTQISESSLYGAEAREALRLVNAFCSLYVPIDERNLRAALYAELKKHKMLDPRPRSGITPCIKLVRMYSGLPLKEAKAYVDAFVNRFGSDGCAMTSDNIMDDLRWKEYLVGSKHV